MHQYLTYSCFTRINVCLIVDLNFSMWRSLWGAQDKLRYMVNVTRHGMMFVIVSWCLRQKTLRGAEMCEATSARHVGVRVRYGAWVRNPRWQMEQNTLLLVMKCEWKQLKKRPAPSHCQATLSVQCHPPPQPCCRWSFIDHWSTVNSEWSELIAGVIASLRHIHKCEENLFFFLVVNGVERERKRLYSHCGLVVLVVSMQSRGRSSFINFQGRPFANKW